MAEAARVDNHDNQAEQVVKLGISDLLAVLRGMSKQPGQWRTRNVLESEVLNRGDIAALLGVSKRKLYRYEHLDPSFPKPVKDVCGTLLWRRRHVMAWIDVYFGDANAGLDEIFRAKQGKHGT